MYIISVPMFGEFLKCSSKRKAFKYAMCRSFLDDTRCIVYQSDTDDLDFRNKLRLYERGKLIKEV